MKEENVREWGTIHPLDRLVFRPEDATASQISPTPENLIYHFAPPLLPPQWPRLSGFAHLNERAAVPSVTELTNLSLTPYFGAAENASGRDSQALALPYGHPRFIDYREEEIPSARSTHPVFPVLLVAAVVFVIWYVYHLTGQRLKLQTDVKTYLETIAHEQQAKADLVAPRMKVLTFEERERSATTAKLFWDVEEQTGQIYFDQLPDAASRETFQLWYLTKDTKFVRANTFRAEQGKATLRIKLPPQLVDQVDRIVVSLEPPDQQPFPVGQILLRGRLR